MLLRKDNAWNTLSLSLILTSYFLTFSHEGLRLILYDAQVTMIFNKLHS